VWDGLCCFSLEIVVIGMAYVVLFSCIVFCVWDGLYCFSVESIAFVMASVVFSGKSHVWDCFRFCSPWR